MAERPNRGTMYVDGVSRGRADTPGFYRQPEIEGQQVTEFGVSPLLQKNTQQEARIFGEGFLLLLRGCSTPSAHPRLFLHHRKQIILHNAGGHGWIPARCW
jgi:hypothetical protein